MMMQSREIFTLFSSSSAVTWWPFLLLLGTSAWMGTWPFLFGVNPASSTMPGIGFPSTSTPTLDSSSSVMTPAIPPGRYAVVSHSFHQMLNALTDCLQLLPDSSANKSTLVVTLSTQQGRFPNNPAIQCHHHEQVHRMLLLLWTVKKPLDVAILGAIDNEFAAIHGKQHLDCMWMSTSKSITQNTRFSVACTCMIHQHSWGWGSQPW